MKIAFLSLGFKPLRLSGLDLSGERLVEGLLAQGHEVTVISGKKGDQPEMMSHDSLKFHRIPIGRSDWIGFAISAGRLLDRLDPFDVVHFWDVQFAAACRLPYLASIQHSFRQRISSLSFEKKGLPFFKKWSYYQAARRFAEIPALHKSEGLLAGSATTRDEFIDHYKIPTERIALARHGIDVSLFSPVSQVELLRTRLDLPMGRPVLLFAGFITPRKGLEYLLEACRMLNPTPVLLVAGRWRSQRYREEVLGRISGSDLRVIETGFVPDDEMPALYSLADIYVSPSLMEGFGLPLAEALACETPVVAAQAGSVAEVVGPAGILVPPANPGALAEALGSLLGDPDRARVLGQMGRERIVREFSLEKMVADTVKAYEHFSGF